MKRVPWSGQTDYRTLLNPTELRQRLQLASLFVFLVETFKDRAVERPQTLFSSGFDQQGIVVNEVSYREHVLCRDKSPVKASLLWFAEMGALSSDDLELFDRQLVARNKLVHQLPELIASGEFASTLSEFPKLLELLRKLEVWWVRNIEIEFHDDPSLDEITDDEILPGSLLLWRMMVDVTLGEGDEAWKWYRGFFPDDSDTPPHGSPTG